MNWSPSVVMSLWSEWSQWKKRLSREFYEKEHKIKELVWIHGTHSAASVIFGQLLKLMVMSVNSPSAIFYFSDCKWYSLAHLLWTYIQRYNVSGLYWHWSYDQATIMSFHVQAQQCSTCFSGKRCAHPNCLRTGQKVRLLIKLFLHQLVTLWNLSASAEFSKSFDLLLAAGVNFDNCPIVL